MVGYTYIMTNKSNTVLYVGATADLVNRVFIHRNRLDSNSFTARYRVTKLVYYEFWDDLEDAFIREKQIKNMHRKDKIILISDFNPGWKDLFKEICE